MYPERKPLRRVETAQDVLQRQHERIVEVIQALLDHISWMRESDLTLNEQAILMAAREFTRVNKRPPQQEAV